MSEKQEKIPTKRQLNSEGSWRARLRCLEAAFARPLKKEGNPSTPESPVSTDWLDLAPPDSGANPHWAAWIPTATRLKETLNQDKAPLKGEATFYVEDYDPVALEHCYAILAQVCRAPHQINLVNMLRWACVATESNGAQWEKPLKHWQRQFLLRDEVVKTIQKLAGLQKHLFKKVSQFHLVADGHCILAVWEGQADEADFLLKGPQRLLKEKKVPHTLIFNQVTPDQAQFGICIPIAAKIPEQSLRCVILLKNPQLAATQTLPQAG